MRNFQFLEVMHGLNLTETNFREKAIFCKFHGRDFSTFPVSVDRQLKFQRKVQIFRTAKTLYFSKICHLCLKPSTKRSKVKTRIDQLTIPAVRIPLEESFFFRYARTDPLETQSIQSRFPPCPYCPDIVDQWKTKSCFYK